MLGATLWLVAALMLTTGVVLDGIAAFARAGLAAAADHALAAGEHAAVAAWQAKLAVQLGAPGATPPPALTGTPAVVPGLANPTLVASGTLPALGEPAFAVTYAARPTTVVAPSCVAPAGSDAIAWLQCSPVVQESRVSLAVTVTVSDTTGTQTLAQRTRIVALRLFASYPYSALVGSADGAADDPSGASPAPHEGDIGGDTVSGEAPAAAPSPWPSGGTLIHVTYRCHDGIVNGAVVYPCANAAPPDPDAALRAGAAWTDGNAPGS